MALLLVDIINSMIQAIVYSYSVECCVNGRNKLNKFKLILMSIIIFVICSGFTSILGNISIYVFIIHIAVLAALVVLYKKDRLKAIVPYSIMYCFTDIYSIIFSNLFFGIIKNIVHPNYSDLAQICTIYIPEIFFIYLWVRYIDRFIDVYKLISSEITNIIGLLTISLCLDFVIASFLIIYNDEAKLLKNIIITILCLFLAFVIVYFGKIKKKSDQIFKLNEALEEKNNELRKIKHDYGAQISYLYGLCLMERFDDLKKALKDIINKNQATPTAVEISENKNSIFSLALKPAIDLGIHVIIEENCNFSLLNIDEMEFYRIISNIVNNAIKAMNGKGIIIAKSYEYLGNMVISIENNGPKIPEQYLQHIFKVGFTTKENSDKNHGYGLSIVKDLVESYGGGVYVKSTDAVTEFKIVLPVKKSI